MSEHRSKEAGNARGPGDGVDGVLAFWFGREGEEGYGERREEWFSKDPGFDREVRERFEADHEEALAGRLDHWQEEARGSLALVILLDQFPRNMFRGSGRMYAADEKALSVAKDAVERGYDLEVLPFQRAFFYLPFIHSERLADQRRATGLFPRIGEPDATEAAPVVARHAEIVERFGRFPHRNGILGRETTPEEAEFLEGPDSSF